MKNRIRSPRPSIMLIQLMMLVQISCPNNKSECTDNANQIYFAEQYIEVKLTTLSGGGVSCKNRKDITLCAQIGNRYHLLLETMVDMKVFAFRIEKDSLFDSCSLVRSNITYIGRADSKKGASTMLSTDNGDPVKLHMTGHDSRIYEEIYLIALHPTFYQDLTRKILGDESMLVNILQHNICARLPGCDPAKNPPPIKDPFGKGGGQDIRLQRVPILRTQ